MRWLSSRWLGVLSVIVVAAAWCARADANVRLLWHKTFEGDRAISGIALSRSGHRLAVAVQPGPGYPQKGIFVFSRAGNLVWQHALPVKGDLGRIVISPDGQKVFCDYTTELRVIERYPRTSGDGRKIPLDEGNIQPLDKVAYSGGIYCFGPTGRVRWKIRRNAVAIVEDMGPPLGQVRQVTRDRLLAVKPGWECERGLTVLDFSGHILLRQEFAQGKAQSIVLWPDGHRLAIGWRENLTIMNLSARTQVGVKGLSFHQWSESVARAMPPDGEVLLARDPQMTRLALVDKAGRLKWSYKFPADWSPYVVPSTGPSAGQRVFAGHESAIGRGPEGTSVLVVRGTRRVLFRFKGLSSVPQQIELPGVEQLPGEEYLSPDGQIIAVVGTKIAADASGKRQPGVTVLSASGAPLGQIVLPRLTLRGAFQGFWPVAFSNPAKYLAIASGPDLYFIEVTR